MSVYLRDPNATPIRIGIYPKRRPLRDGTVPPLGISPVAPATFEPRYADFLAIEQPLASTVVS